MHLLRLVSACAIFLFGVTAAQAQHLNAADSPCTSHSATSDLANCFSTAYGDADSDLKGVYGAIIAFLDSEHRSDDKQALQESQRLWIQYRDADCHAASGLYGEGTAGPVTRFACLWSETQHRTEDLKTGYGWLLEKFGHPLDEGENPINYIPLKGYVPDESTAIAVAVSMLKPVYGQTMIDGEKPFHATLKDGIWHVKGTLKSVGGGITLGGVAIVELDQHTGRVIRMIHEQ